MFFSGGKSKNSFWTSLGLCFALLLSINLVGVEDTPGTPCVNSTLHMPLGLEVRSSPCPHPLALCHSLWSTPVSIPDAFNILYILSKPLSSLSSVFQWSCPLLKLCHCPMVTAQNSVFHLNLMRGFQVCWKRCGHPQLLGQPLVGRLVTNNSSQIFPLCQTTVVNF